jgi:hypothetical protein
MAILQSRTQTGISWVKESVALFITAPRKWLSVALVYVGLFMMLPSVPGLQFFALISILIWPVFLAIALAIYRNAEMKKQQTVGEIITQIQPKISQGLEALVGNKEKMTESQMLAFLQKMFPLLLKLTLLLIPLMMATWFAPMLIAFNNYNLVKAIKSSIAGSIQYMVALGAAWMLLTGGIILLMLVVGIVVGLISAMLPVLGQMLMSIILFGALLLATALMLAFQYISYRDVFRAA